MSDSVFKIVVIEQGTQRVWYEVRGVNSAEEALAAYRQGHSWETYRKFISVDASEIETIYQEEQDALSMD